MTIKNYIFQIQNAIYQTIKNSNITCDVIMNRGQSVVYPYIMISGTKKTEMDNTQKELITELNVLTKDFSVISASSVLERLEDIITRQILQENISYYSVHFAQCVNSTVFTTDEGFFHGKISITTILDGN
jgi:hypothetical protein